MTGPRCNWHIIPPEKRASSPLDGQDNNSPPGINDANYNDGDVPSTVDRTNVKTVTWQVHSVYPAVNKKSNDTSELLV